ncbi:MAG: hypothetical protein OEY43_03525 [Gammaproteobacteria bacterium]|nr:hypothetical protein [Gammaproteobacteria bacterium]
MQTEAYLETSPKKSHYAFSAARENALHFDEQLDRLIDIAHQLILNKGVFHLQIHFAASQLTCWTFDNPYNYQVYQAEAVFDDNFQLLFSTLESNLYSTINKTQVLPVLKALKFLRERPEGSELRNASLHIMNGLVGLSFACDDTRYINFKELLV